MKTKIAKQEGDLRNAKKLNESLDKQIKMLEKALKNERVKNRTTAPGETALPTEEEVKKEWKDKLGIDSESRCAFVPNGYSWP